MDEANDVLQGGGALLKGTIKADAQRQPTVYSLDVEVLNNGRLVQAQHVLQPRQKVGVLADQTVSGDRYSELQFLTICAVPRYPQPRHDVSGLFAIG